MPKQPPNHLDFLYDVGELTTVLTDSADLGACLQRLAALVAKHLHTAVCSIYLPDETGRSLVLRATVGLSPAAVGTTRLKAGEGLAGQAFEELRPILDNHASRNPRFKAFPAIGEAPFDCFLAVPIRRGLARVGVLCVQRRQGQPFRAEDAKALQTVAAQFAGLIGNARALLGPSPAAGGPGPVRRSGMQVIRGQAVSGGSATGPALLLDRHVPPPATAAPGPVAGGTEDDLVRAAGETARQIKELQDRIARRLPEAASLIFDAHLLMLHDDGFVGEMRRRARAGQPAGLAVREVAAKYVALFAASPQAYLREKVKDIEDIAQRLHANLDPAGRRTESAAGGIVIARDLYPSDIVMRWAEGAKGFVLTSGGITTHVAILARSLQIPAVIADAPALAAVAPGTPLLIDGGTGNLYLQPRAEVVKRFAESERIRVTAHQRAVEMRPATATRDGERITLRANINLLSEVALARELKAEGIGLYRTEFPFLIRTSFPSEEEQAGLYARLVDGMRDQPVTFRTLDVGGEKALGYFDQGHEANPELGLRSIRFCFRHPDIFTAQLRAILRAGVAAKTLRLMFPMISSLDEFREARQLVLTCREALRAEGVPHAATPAIGMMIELPAVVELIDAFAEEADFFSVGTNDFVQYLLGADRGNELVADAYCPHHPSVLRALARVTAAAARHGKELTICGEMAHRPEYLPVLIGLGVRTFSVDPHHLPDMQARITALDLSQAQALAREILAEPTIAGIARLLHLPAKPV